MADPYRFFRIEAIELTDAIEAGLLELERGEGSLGAALAAVLRHAHTLKGAARVVRHAASANLAHALEDLLVPVRDAGVELSQDMVSHGLTMVDALRHAIAELDAPAAQTPAAANGASTGPKAAESVANAEPHRQRSDPAADAETVRQLLEHTLTLGDQLTRLGSAREHLGDLRRRMNDGYRVRPLLVGATARAADAGYEAPPYLDDVVQLERDLSLMMEGTTRVLRQLREGLERLRLRPTDDLRGALERTTRDAALAVGKQVRLEFHGGALRVEPELHAAAQRALLQAVKNAVAHGIETPEARAAQGKDPVGRVSVSVARQGSSVVFCCDDDGRGLDLDAVQKTVLARSPGAAVPTTEQALIDALLSGGVSTASSVTAVAGRGIGLDLIREVAQSIGGTLRLHNRPGQGVRLELEAKAELAAAPALLVLASGVVYALPLGVLFRTLRHEVALGSEPSVELLVDDAMVPFRPLAALLEPETPLAARRRSWTVVLCKHEGEILALGVDRLLGTESVVSQPLPNAARTTPALAGFSTGFDGTPRFLLDPAWLRQAAHTPWNQSSVEAAPPDPILVIDDSLTTRMLERSILESAGYEVELATSAEEGLELARQRRYALFLVDVEMPGMDGFTFIQTAHADPTLRSIPAILVTSRNSPEDIARGARAGARGHVVKGEFDQVDLLERIGRLVSER